MHTRKRRWAGGTWISVLLVWFVLNALSTPAIGADGYKAELFSNMRSTFGFGMGLGKADVRDTKSQLQLDSYNDESGLSFNVRFTFEWPVNSYLAFQTGADVFNSASASSLFSATASYAGTLNVGVIIGKVAQMQQPYLSLSFGAGVVYLSDQGPDTGCIVCSGDKGGWANGPASRVALGMAIKTPWVDGHESRIELVWMRAGGDGSSSDFPDDVDAHLNTVLIVLSAIH